MTRVGQRVGSRVGQRVGQVVTATPSGHGPLTHAIPADGLTRWGLATWATAPPDQEDGVTVVIEMAQTATPAAYKVAFRFDSTATLSRLAAECPTGAQSVWTGLYSTTADGTTSTPLSTAAPTHDSAGYALYSCSIQQQAGPQREVVIRNRGVADTANARTRIGSGDVVEPSMRQLLLCSATTGGSFLMPGLVARWAVFPGVISADDMTALFADVDWRTALDGRTPHGYWLAQDGADDGTTLRVPSLIEGAPDTVWTATQVADLSTTVPTRVAA